MCVCSFMMRCSLCHHHRNWDFRMVHIWVYRLTDVCIICVCAVSWWGVLVSTQPGLPWANLPMSTSLQPSGSAVLSISIQTVLCLCTFLYFYTNSPLSIYKQCSISIQTVLYLYTNSPLSLSLYKQSSVSIHTVLYLYTNSPLYKQSSISIQTVLYTNSPLSLYKQSSIQIVKCKK